MKFEVSRTLGKRYSSFFETIFLISRIAKVFSVKSREKHEKIDNNGVSDLSASVNGHIDASSK